MLALILAVLKVIGIVLLVILCLILLIVAAVLFVPLRYKITGDYRGSPEKPTGEAFVSWLFGFIRAKAQYGADGFHYFVKILPFTILSDTKKPKKKKRKTKKSRKKAASENAQEESSKTDAEAQTEEFDDREKIKAEKTKREENGSSSETERKPSGIRAIFDKLRNLPDKIRKKFRRFLAKLKGIGNKFSKIRKIFEDPAYLRLAKNLYAKVKRILHFLKPSKADIQVTYGSDDPSQTGTVTAIVAAACGFFGWQDVAFTPDFENEVLKAHVYLKGKLRLIHVLVIAIQVLTDADFRRIVLHKGEKNKKRKHSRKNTGAAVPEVQAGQKG